MRRRALVRPLILELLSEVEEVGRDAEAPLCVAFTKEQDLSAATGWIPATRARNLRKHLQLGGRNWFASTLMKVGADVDAGCTLISQSLLRWSYPVDLDRCGIFLLGACHLELGGVAAALLREVSSCLAAVEE